MGVFSEKELEREEWNERNSSSSKKIPKYEKEYEEFRKRYRANSPRRTMEPKRTDRENDEEQELEY